MRPAEDVVPALAEHLLVVGDDGADDGVGVYPAEAALRQFNGALEMNAIGDGGGGHGVS